MMVKCEVCPSIDRSTKQGDTKKSTVIQRILSTVLSSTIKGSWDFRTAQSQRDRWQSTGLMTNLQFAAYTRFT